jgi:hypothetical protein
MCKYAHSTDGEGMESMCRPLAITIENLWLVLSYVRPSVGRLVHWLVWVCVHGSGTAGEASQQAVPCSLPRRLQHFAHACTQALVAPSSPTSSAVMP